MLQLRRATMHDLDTIIGLIDKAAAWLRTKNTTQWATPWPDRPARDERVRAGIMAEQTWILEAEDGTVAATVSMDYEGNPKLWNESELDVPAVYVQRLVIDRRFSRIGLGAELIDWAGRHARQRYGAQRIRIDVWTTNNALHRYYESAGFTFKRFSSEPDYPAGALLEKATDDIAVPENPLFEDHLRSRLHSLASWMGGVASQTCGTAQRTAGRLRNAVPGLPAYRLTGPAAVAFMGCAQFWSLLGSDPWLDRPWSSALDGLWVLFLATALLMINPRALWRRRHRPSLSERLRQAVSDRRIQLLFIMMAAVTVATDPALVFGPAPAKQVVGSEVWAGYFIVALSVGTILGSLMPGRIPSLRVTARLIGALGLAMIVFAFAAQTWLSVLAALAAGAMTLVAGATTQTLLLAGNGRHNARQVMAAWALAFAGGRPIASLIDGLVSGAGGGIRMTSIALELPALVVGALAFPALAKMGRSYLAYRPLVIER